MSTTQDLKSEGIKSETTEAKSTEKVVVIPPSLQDVVDKTSDPLIKLAITRMYTEYKTKGYLETGDYHLWNSTSIDFLLIVHQVSKCEPNFHQYVKQRIRGYLKWYEGQSSNMPKSQIKHAYKAICRAPPRRRSKLISRMGKNVLIAGSAIFATAYLISLFKR